MTYCGHWNMIEERKEKVTEYGAKGRGRCVVRFSNIEDGARRNG